jgi:hypothetical protein
MKNKVKKQTKIVYIKDDEDINRIKSLISKGLGDIATTLIDLLPKEKKTNGIIAALRLYADAGNIKKAEAMANSLNKTEIDEKYKKQAYELILTKCFELGDLQTVESMAGLLKIRVKPEHLEKMLAVNLKNGNLHIAQKITNKRLRRKLTVEEVTVLINFWLDKNNFYKAIRMTEILKKDQRELLIRMIIKDRIKKDKYEEAVEISRKNNIELGAESENIFNYYRRNYSFSDVVNVIILMDEPQKTTFLETMFYNAFSEEQAKESFMIILAISEPKKGELLEELAGYWFERNETNTTKAIMLMEDSKREAFLQSLFDKHMAKLEEKISEIKKLKILIEKARTENGKTKGNFHPNISYFETVRRTTVFMTPNRKISCLKLVLKKSLAEAQVNLSLSIAAEIGKKLSDQELFQLFKKSFLEKHEVSSLIRVDLISGPDKDYFLQKISDICLRDKKLDNFSKGLIMLRIAEHIGENYSFDILIVAKNIFIMEGDLKNYNLTIKKLATTGNPKELKEILAINVKKGCLENSLETAKQLKRNLTSKELGTIIKINVDQNEEENGRIKIAQKAISILNQLK